MLKLEISGIHMDADEKLKKYVTKKIGKLDKFLPRTARESARAEAILRESKGKKNAKYTFEVIMDLPGQRLTAKEAAMNHFTAVDIVEAKLRNQLKKYKDTHNVRRIHRRVIARIKRG